MNELLEFIKEIEKVFTVKAKAIRIDKKVVLREGKFQQKREKLKL